MGWGGWKGGEERDGWGPDGDNAQLHGWMGGEKKDWGAGIGMWG